MSTNITVDVLLQRLKQISDQVTGQNREERQEREDTLQQQQQSGSKTTRRSQTLLAIQSTRQGQSASEDARARSAAEHSSVPDLYKKRRPAAQRIEIGSTMGVEYTTQIIPGTPSATLRLVVGPPSLQQKVQVDLLEPSGAAASNLPPTTDSSSGSESVLGFLITYASPDFFGNNWRTEYPCGYTFQTGPGTAPTTSWTEYTTPRVVTQTYDDSRAYLLPVGNKGCIFVYLYSKLKVLTVFERFGRTDRVSTNPRETSSGCSSMPGTYYDRESTFQEIDTLDNVEQRQRYEVLAFYVDENSVRQLDVPQQFTDAIRALHPPLEVNDTEEQVTSSVFTRFEFADVAGSTDPSNYNGPVTYGYSTIPAVNISKQRQSSLHGNYVEVNARNDVLAKQFGLGYLNTESHDGLFFTPAVYTFMRSPMNLSVPAVQTYAHMRSTYFTRAPKRYLAPCVIATSCTEQQSVGFDQTTTAPINIDTAVADADFKRERKYDVVLNGSYDYEVVYGWDWDQPDYCAQQLKALGFTAADLKP